MSDGYTGKILHVNLTTSEITVEEPEEQFYRTYMGGSAMGMHYVLKETPEIGRASVGKECRSRWSPYH